MMSAEPIPPTLSVAASAAAPQSVTLGRYKDSRFWAIWINDELLAVTVYRKGARAMLAYMGLEKIAVELKPPRKPRSRHDLVIDS
jgi:hypothetical protein